MTGHFAVIFKPPVDSGLQNQAEHERIDSACVGASNPYNGAAVVVALPARLGCCTATRLQPFSPSDGE